MVIHIYEVSKQARCNAADATHIIFRLAACLAGKFPGTVADEWFPTAEEVQRWVSWRHVANIIALLKQGTVPIRLYGVLPHDVRELLIAEEANAAHNQAPAEEPPATPPQPTVAQADGVTDASDSENGRTAEEIAQVERQKRHVPPLGAGNGFRWCKTPGCCGEVRNGERCEICELYREDSPPPPRVQDTRRSNAD